MVFERHVITNDHKQLRRDPLTGRWVKLIPTGDKRLREIFGRWRSRNNNAITPTHVEGCYCCPDHPELTNPPILHQYTPHGTLTVTTPKQDLNVTIFEEPVREPDGLYDRMTPVGIDETIIMGDNHAVRLTELPADFLSASLSVCRDRIRDLNQNRCLQNFMFWTEGNYYDESMGTYRHPCWHINSEAHVLRRIEEEIGGCMHYYFPPQEKERCLICDLIRFEQEKSVRVIWQSDHHLVWAPYAARYPFEIWIAPLRHGAFFQENPEVRDLSMLIKRALTQLEGYFGPHYLYTVTLHSGPRKFGSYDSEKIAQAYHWRLRIVPFLGPSSMRAHVKGENEHVVFPEVAARLLMMPSQDIEAWLQAKDE
ncbi:MAG: hypothetical protein WCT27_02080 [Patescibacteria group bacterium]